MQVNPEFQQHTKVTKPLSCGMPRLGLLTHDAAPPRIHNKGLCIDSESELELPWRPGVTVVGAGCSGQLPTLQVDHLQPSYRSSRQAQSLCRAWSHVTDARPGPCKYHSVVQCEKLLFTNTLRAGFLFGSVGNVEKLLLAVVRTESDMRCDDAQAVVDSEDASSHSNQAK